MADFYKYMLSLLLLHIAVGKLLNAPFDLKVNYISTHEHEPMSSRTHLPIAEIIDANNAIKTPIFSWRLPFTNITNDIQTFYEIEIYNLHAVLLFSTDLITSNHPFSKLHMTHKNMTSSLHTILSKYIWKVLSYRVRWYNKYNIPSKWSSFGRFIVTSSINADWNNASYIASPTNGSAPYFIKTITTSRNTIDIDSATISIIGLGFFRLYINNRDYLSSLSPEIMQLPGWTNPEYRVPYTTFDVTQDIINGPKNSIFIKILLGEGYRNSSAYFILDTRSPTDNIDCILKAQLILTYQDGTQQIIVTDNTWKTYPSPIVSNSIYNGEIYDQHLEYYNKNESLWINAIVTIGPPGIMYPTVQPHVTLQKTIHPIEMYKNTNHKSTIFRFNSNNAGIILFNISDLNDGDVIKIRHAEVPQHPPYGPVNGDLYYDNLKTAQATDIYIASDNTPINPFHRALFTYHGFTYIEVWGYPYELKLSDFVKLEFHANIEQRSFWNSSNINLNTIHQHCIEAQKSNIMSVITDCDQRDERLGWMGDASLSSDSYAINFDMQSFIYNWLVLMKDEQITNKSDAVVFANKMKKIATENHNIDYSQLTQSDSIAIRYGEKILSLDANQYYGSIPETVPSFRYGARPSDPNWGINFAQYIFIMTKYFGMKELAQEYIENGALPLYITNLQNRMPANGLINYPGQDGDWVPPYPANKTNLPFTSSFGFIQTVRIIEMLANVTNNTEFANDLRHLYQSLKAEFFETFWNKTQYVKGTQTSYALALEAGLYPNETILNMLKKNFVMQIKNDGNKLTTGIIGTKFIFPILSEMNQTELALYLILGGDTTMNATYPSYRFMFNNSIEPALATWELWNSPLTTGDYPDNLPHMDSRNQQMFTTVSAYLSEYISGLKQGNQYNKYELNIGHLSKDILEWSTIRKIEGLTYTWKWLNDARLDINITIPVGYFVDVKFRLKNRTNCKWKLHSTDNIDLIDMKLGCGEYIWQLLCSL
eukprot:164321_1